MQSIRLLEGSFDLIQRDHVHKWYVIEVQVPAIRNFFTTLCPEIPLTRYKYPRQQREVFRYVKM